MKHILLLNEYLTESVRYSSGMKQNTIIKVQGDLLESFKGLLRLDESSIIYVGSAGKRKSEDISYNINMYIDVNKLIEENNIENISPLKFIKEQLKRLKLNITEDGDRLICNIKENNESSELHIKLTDNLEWIKFSRYSPNLNENESNYIGKYREAVFSAISKIANKKIVSYFDTNENVKEYETYRFFVDEGLCVVTKSFEGKNGILKYPRLIESSKRILSDDPNEFVKILFGDKFNIDNVKTFENCLEIIKSKDFRFSKRKNEIFKRIKQEIVNLNLSIPENLN